MKLLSKIHYKNLIRLGETNPKCLVLSADLTGSCEADGFRDQYPNRFISCGISEQNMLSVAGGLAREGFVPLIHTFAVFIYRRALDQLEMSIAYPNLPVKMFGFLPGVTTPGGATHQATDDIAILRALPNITIYEVGDAREAEDVLQLAVNTPGPVYVRMLRGQLPVLFNDPMQPGVPRILCQGTDISLVSSGICTEEALRAVAALQARGVSVQHMHVSTLKPFNNPIIAESLKKGKHGVITLENHVLNGGLGTIVAEKLVQNRINSPLIKLGLNDTYAHGASKGYLMKHYQMDATAAVAAAEKLLGRKLNISEQDLSEIRIDAVHSQAKAEAL